MKWPWDRDIAAQAETERAREEYEETVRNRSLVSALVSVMMYHGAENGFVEKVQKVARGH
jgi:hypothetical protein